jgi:hypothetical protein
MGNHRAFFVVGGCVLDEKIAVFGRTSLPAHEKHRADRF